MPRSDYLRSSIQSLLESFTEQLEALVQQAALERVMTALGGDAPATPGKRRGRPKGSGRKPGRPAGAGRVRRDSGDMDAMQGRLLAHVKANPGQRGEQIAAAMNSDVGTIRLPMKKLIAAKQVRTEGQRRGMTYHPGGGGRGRPAKAKTAKRGKKAARKAKRAKNGRRGKRAAKAMVKTAPAETKQAA